MIWGWGWWSGYDRAGAWLSSMPPHPSNYLKKRIFKEVGCILTMEEGMFIRHYNIKEVWSSLQIGVGL